MPQPTQPIDRMIASIMADRPSRELNSERYPYAYAYDFFAEHADRFGAELLMNRSEASDAVTEYCDRTNQLRQSVVIALADAYLAKHGIEASALVKLRLLDHAFRGGWGAHEVGRSAA